MKTFQTLSYSDIQQRSAQHQMQTGLSCYRDQWGTVTEQKVLEKHVAVTKHTFDLVRKIRIQFEESTMPDTMNMCMVLHGQVDVWFNGRQKGASLSASRHHALYVNESQYDIRVENTLQTVHIAIDLGYYINLLCDREAWSASLKERLLRKEDVLEGDGIISIEMQKAIHYLLDNPLHGNTRSLFMEAKVLELVALQLNQFGALNKKSSGNWSRTEVDVFHELRAYLDTHFTDDLSLRQLARLFGLNDFKLKRGFKELFNSTVFEYIHALRMEYAYRLLADEKMFVNEVSGKVGYKNPNHFSTAFKRQFGVCPGVLR